MESTQNKSETFELQIFELRFQEPTQPFTLQSTLLFSNILMTQEVEIFEKLNYFLMQQETCTKVPGCMDFNCFLLQELFRRIAAMASRVAAFPLLKVSAKDL